MNIDHRFDEAKKKEAWRDARRFETANEDYELKIKWRDACKLRNRRLFLLLLFKWRDKKPVCMFAIFDCEERRASEKSEGGGLRANKHWLFRGREWQKSILSAAVWSNRKQFYGR